MALSKTYGSVHAVRDLSLHVRRGEVFGLLGPEGAGKTTTMRLLLALQRATGGHAAVLGLDAWRDRVEIHRRTGYLPQDIRLLPHQTGGQVMAWFARARGGVDRRVVGALTERLEVDLDRPLRDLSPSNRKKVGLVLACMHRPDLLLLDEPATGLDASARREFESLVREAVNEGRTVFFSTRELDEARRLSNRVAVLKAGELITVAGIEGLRRAAPDRIEARVRKPVDTSLFAQAGGATVRSYNGSHIELEVTGRLAPVLRLLADLDPVDVVARHAQLDDLLGSFQRRTDVAAPTAHASSVSAAAPPPPPPPRRDR